MPDLIDSSSEEEDEKEDEVAQPPPKEKWAAAEQREFINVNRLDSTDNSDEDIVILFARNLTN